MVVGRYQRRFNSPSVRGKKVKRKVQISLISEFGTRREIQDRRSESGSTEVRKERSETKKERHKVSYEGPKRSAFMKETKKGVR